MKVAASEQDSALDHRPFEQSVAILVHANDSLRIAVIDL